MKTVVHCADISSPSMEFEDFKAWGLRVTQEFHDQYMTEMAIPSIKESNPPPPFMKWETYKSFVSSQIGFTSKYSLAQLINIIIKWPALRYPSLLFERLIYCFDTL